MLETPMLETLGHDNLSPYSSVAVFFKHHNADPKPYVWTKSATEVLQKVARANKR